MIDRRDPLHYDINARTETLASGGELVVQSTQLTIAAADTATIVYFAAVGHAVAAGAGGVVAPAHAARVNDLPTFRDSITPSTRLSIATAHATSVQLLAAVGNTIASLAG